MSPFCSSEASSAPELTEKEKALARAKELIETDWYSHGTLLNQLQAVEGFSYEASKYGADNCGADWKEMAGKAAKHRADMSPVPSPNVIESFLNACYFNTDEVDAGKNALDWAALAKAYAKESLAEGTWSYIQLGNYMFGEGFDSADINNALTAITEDEWKQEAAEYAGSTFTSEKFMELVEKIKTDGSFTEDQAIYGAENFGIDWYNAAVIDGSNYLYNNPTSRIYFVDYMQTVELYSQAQAEYAADQMDFYQAAADVASYADMSYTEIYSLLFYTYEFTNGEAVYGANQQDYYEKAVKAAQYYPSFTYFEIIENLMDSGFSQDQAEYGVNNGTSKVRGDDPAYQKALAYYMANPGATGPDVYNYLTSVEGYSSTMANLIVDHLPKG